MISKNETKVIHQLYNKKHRLSKNAFIAETPRVVDEFLRSGWRPMSWYATPDYSPAFPGVVEPTQINDRELKQISRLETPNSVLAVFAIPEAALPASGRLTLALDGVRDPGNLGTILRLADWFGWEQVWLSGDCVDPWNPKVVQSAMGSLARVAPVILDLATVAADFQRDGGQVWVADLDGDSVYSSEWPDKVMLIMGNEAHGPSEDILKTCNRRVSIPRFGEAGAESLNVAMATGIILSEYRRQKG